MSVKNRWDRLTAIPLTILSLVYIALYAFEVLANLGGVLRTSFEYVSDSIWAIFVVDYAIRLFWAKDRKSFLINNSVELASLVLPAIRAFRMLRIITALNQMTQFAKSKGARVNLSLAAGVPLFFFMCALGILDVERSAAGATIISFKLALWWSLTTLATVGYGDLYPVTDSGKLIAALLMFSGIGLMSVITANIATWFMRNLGNRNSRADLGD